MWEVLGRHAAAADDANANFLLLSDGEPLNGRNEVRHTGHGRALEESVTDREGMERPLRSLGSGVAELGVHGLGPVGTTTTSGDPADSVGSGSLTRNRRPSAAGW